MKPKINVKGVSFGSAAPVFEYGTTHIAHAQVTNLTPGTFIFNGELYLTADKLATSGLVPFTLFAHQTAVIDFPITMPANEGMWSVLLDIRIGIDGELIAAYEAIEKVTVIVTPEIVVGPITWD